MLLFFGFIFMIDAAFVRKSKLGKALPYFKDVGFLPFLLCLSFLGVGWLRKLEGLKLLLDVKGRPLVSSYLVLFLLSQFLLVI